MYNQILVYLADRGGKRRFGATDKWCCNICPDYDHHTTIILHIIRNSIAVIEHIHTLNVLFSFEWFVAVYRAINPTTYHKRSDANTLACRNHGAHSFACEQRLFGVSMSLTGGLSVYSSSLFPILTDNNIVAIIALLCLPVVRRNSTVHLQRPSVHTTCPFDSPHEPAYRVSRVTAWLSP